MRLYSACKSAILLQGSIKIIFRVSCHLKELYQLKNNIEQVYYYHLSKIR